MKFEEVERVKDLDIEIQASGFIKKELKNASKYYNKQTYFIYVSINFI